MERDDNIIDYLYEKKEEDMLFTSKDKEYEELQNKITIADNEINTFIEKKVHPKSRKLLRKLFINYGNAVFVSASRENQLYYRYGVEDGIKILIASLYGK